MRALAILCASVSTALLLFSLALLAGGLYFGGTP